MYKIILTPPIAFLILLAVIFAVSAVAKRFAAKGKDVPGKSQAYACGEVMPHNRTQPEYRQYFKFAFFFTIMHVVVMIVATDPEGISAMSAAYLGITILSLFMLFRR